MIKEARAAMEKRASATWVWLRERPVPSAVGLSVGVMLLIILGVVSFSSGAADATIVNGELTHKVKRGHLSVSFTERGEVKAARSVPIYCQLDGTSTIVWVVPEGSYVKEGDLLVELGSASLEQEMNQQQITVDSARAALKQAEEQLKIQESLNQSNLDAARLEVELAEIDLERYVEGDFPQAKKKAENDILIAQEELARAEDKYEWSKKLAAKGYVTRMDEQADRLAVQRARVQYDQALKALEVLEKWTHKKDLKTYQSAVEQARAALTRAESKAGAELEQAKADEQAKRSTYLLSVERLQKVKDQLSKTKIHAPQDGLVVYETPNYRRGRETVVEQGAEVRENQQLMQLPDVSVMAVDVQVHEAWIDQVREGLTAFVSIDALPNLNLRGRITKVGLLPDSVNRWLNPDLKVYKTEVTIDAGQDMSLLRPGMSAKVRIVITDLRDVVHVPVQSVSSIDRKQVCYVLDGREFRPREVKGGLYNESYIQIVDGLEPGEVLQLTAPKPRGSAEWGGPAEEAEAGESPPEVAADGTGPEDGAAPGAGRPGRSRGEGRAGAPSGGGRRGYAARGYPGARDRGRGEESSGSDEEGGGRRGRWARRGEGGGRPAPSAGSEGGFPRRGGFRRSEEGARRSEASGGARRGRGRGEDGGRREVDARSGERRGSGRTGGGERDTGAETETEGTTR